MDEYDLIVIGTGGAAMAAGIEARSRGNSVLLVEHGPLGGTCLNIGCVPSKNLLAAAGQRHRAATHPFEGISTSAGPVALGALMEQKQALIDRLRQAKYADVADAHGFPILQGHARFIDQETLQVDGQALRARHGYVVATGVAPHIPDLPGLGDVAYLTSTTVTPTDRDTPAIGRRPRRRQVSHILGSGTSGI